MIRSMNSDKRRWMMLAVSMAAFVAVGCGGKADGEAEEESTLPTKPVPVEAVRAQLTTLKPSVELVGRVVPIPEKTATVSPHIGRWIESLKVVEGQRVKAGEELFVLDSRLAKIDQDRAAAVVDEKQAILIRMQRGYLPQEIAMARRDVDKAAATANGLRKKLNALEGLRARREVSLVEYQTVQSSLRAAEAARAAAEQNLKLLLAGTRPAEVRRAEAQLKSAQADLAAADLAVKFCRITSPITGIVTNLSARRGLFVERATPLATIVNNTHLFAQIRIPGAYLSQVRIGTTATVRFASLPGSTVSGKVARLSGQADPTTGDVDAFVEMANPKGLLQPGLSCRVRVLLPAVPDAVAVPTVAIADRSGTPVLTVVRDKKAYEIEVTLGVQTAESVQVKTGVASGELVITRGGYGLPKGCPVKVAIRRTTPARH